LSQFVESYLLHHQLTIVLKTWTTTQKSAHCTVSMPISISVRLNVFGRIANVDMASVRSGNR